MRRMIFIAALAGSMLAGACATAPTKTSPWQVPRADFEARVHTIAIHGPWVPSDLEDAEAVKEQFEGLITDKLTSMGYSVVPAKEAAQIWASVSETLGGLYEPATGELDETKQQAARKHTLTELETKFDVDAVLHARIKVVRAQFSGSNAYWCDTSQAVTGGGQAFFEALGGVTTSGTVPALCLTVVIEDTSGVDLYKDWGGIEVLSMRKGSGFERVPREQLFVTHERNQVAIDLAFDGFAAEQVAASVQ